MAENFTPIDAAQAGAHFESLARHYNNVPPLAYGVDHHAELNSTGPDRDVLAENEGTRIWEVLGIAGLIARVKIDASSLNDGLKKKGDGSVRGSMYGESLVNDARRDALNIPYIRLLIREKQINGTDVELKQLGDAVDAFEALCQSAGVDVPTEDMIDLRTHGERIAEENGGK